MMPPRPKVAYFVSRFPHVSETFVVREMNEVARLGADLRVYSLFRARAPIIHPSARPWVDTHRRASMISGLRSLLWWGRRSPGQLITTLRSLGKHLRGAPRAIVARELATTVLALDVARDLAETGVDHIHAHFASYPTTAAWVCHRLTGAPFTFTAHAHDIFVDQSLLALKCRDAAAVVAISDYNRAFLAPRYASASQVVVVRCGIDPGAYALRSESSSTHIPATLLCVASLQQYKGHAVLLSALALATQPALREAHLHLVGAGELHEELLALTQSLGIADRVTFHGGLPENEVTELLAKATLFVLPSVVDDNGQMDGIPVALMEAMACGVPVVSTQLSGIPELVRAEETGWLAETGSPESLRDVLQELLAEPGLARARAVQARELVEREYDLAHNARALARLFIADGD